MDVDENVEGTQNSEDKIHFKTVKIDASIVEAEFMCELLNK